MEKEFVKKTKSKKRKVKKIIINTILFLAFLISGVILLNKSVRFETKRLVKYDENSNIDYKVYLVKNDFYEKDYLEKDMLYVASLIDKIKINFKYKFKSEIPEDIKFTYNIYGKLSINNITNTKSYFEKTYTLLEDKSINMNNNKEQIIDEELDIDYSQYNKIANSFKSQFGVETESKLTVYMVISKKNAKNGNFNLDNSSIMNVKIPLSERAIDIKLDYKEINETNNIIEELPIGLKEILPIIISIILIIISIIFMIKIIRIINSIRIRKSIYDKYIAKLLKEYDRLIAESSSLLSFKDKEIIEIKKFTELLDIHDNLQLPIMFYEEEPHKLAYFYITHDNVIYLLTIKEEDISKKQI